jgi:hypothetical protein
MDFHTEERDEALRQVRYEGHHARTLPDHNSIMVMRMEDDRPVTGEWETISCLFYDAWLDGDDVPRSRDEAMGGGK